METPQLPAQPSEGGNPDFGGSAQAASPRNPDSKGMKDHEMPELPEATTCPRSEPHSEKEQGSACIPTENSKAPLDLLAREEPQRASGEAPPNPFATPGKKSKEDPDLSEPPEEPTGGWIFQGRKKNTPTRAATRQESPQALLHTPQREATPGGKKGLLHSEVHHSYFTSLGILAPENKDPLRVMIWPVLFREKDDHKEVLMHSKPHSLPNLPLSIRHVGPAIEPEAEWTPDAAWADLIHQVELELEEQILRFKFTNSERPQLEWSWQETLSRGGMECTMLVHIHTGARGVSVQKKKHLHWKALEQTLSLDNEVAFATPAHNLLMRSGEEDSTRQAIRNRWASLRASPHVARKKKRFTRLDMSILMNPGTSSPDPAQGEPLEDWQVGEFTAEATSGSFNPPVARNKLTYV
ncbi:unnamed protein product [Sphagnum balticum]